MTTILLGAHIIGTVRMLAFQLLLTLVLTSTPAIAQTIADFEPGSTPSINPVNATAQTATDGAPQGQRFLRLTATTPEPSRAYVRLPVPDDSELPRRERLSAQLRAPNSHAPVELRWLAIDENRRPIFQRRFTLAPGEKWITLDEPLRDWRWDNRFVGDWDEVREIALRIESASASVDVDDIRLTGEASPDERVNALLKLAFGDKPVKRMQTDEMLVATDAVDAFGDAELSQLLKDMAQARAFVRRAFGDAVRPTDDNGPLALLIFADQGSHRAFFEKLAEQWRAEIAPPMAQGYTVQDIATSTYRAELGPRRPVYIHEATHAIVARDLRLQSGHAPHSPLQEGIANFVQLCFHPNSIERRAYVENFAKPVDPQGRSFFKPLDTLFATRATPREYAQLASVVAYLLENDPQLLRELARGLADGQTAQNVLEKQGKTWQQVQDGWHDWGRQRFAAGHAQDPPFAVPSEIR